MVGAPARPGGFGRMALPMLWGPWPEPGRLCLCALRCSRPHAFMANSAAWRGRTFQAHVGVAPRFVFVREGPVSGPGSQQGEGCVAESPGAGAPPTGKGLPGWGTKGHSWIRMSQFCWAASKVAVHAYSCMSSRAAVLITDYEHCHSRAFGCRECVFYTGPIVEPMHAHTGP